MDREHVGTNHNSCTYPIFRPNDNVSMHFLMIVDPARCDARDEQVKRTASTANHSLETGHLSETDMTGGRGMHVKRRSRERTKKIGQKKGQRLEMIKLNNSLNNH